MDIGDYQRQAASTDVLPANLELALLGLVGEVGQLAAEYKKRQRDGPGYRLFEEEVREELGDLIWYVAAIARRCDVDLSQVLVENLRKTRERFLPPVHPPMHLLFDQGRDPNEQLPRILDLTFVEGSVEREGRPPVPVVRIFKGQEPMGDPLDDNSDDNDDYRFHDALHLGNLAILGWSPTMRSLLRVKRSSDKNIDRIEDGGRAIVVEEGLIAYVFSVAAAHSFFENSRTVPLEVIKTCQRMTAHLEVSSRSSQDWNYAILEGIESSEFFARSEAAPSG